MENKIAERIVRAVTAMLLTTGILMPVLGVLDRSFAVPGMLMISAGIILVFELISLHRISALAGGIAAAAAFLIWAFSGNGSRVLSDFMIALTLRIRGIDTALPLIAESGMILVTCIITILCCLASIREATCLPALILCLGAGLMIWLTDRRDLIPWLLPALAALVALMMTTRFSGTPLYRVLPWAGGIVLLAFLMTGNGAVVPELKEKADEIRRDVLDRLFFTEARDVFSLYSAGLSPQGPEQLGGKPHPDNDPVMTVSTPVVTYLRGSIYDEYTGHGWRNTVSGRRYLWQNERMTNDRALLFDQNLPPENIQNSLTREVSLTVRMMRDSMSTLFLPQRIRELIPGTNMVPYFSNSSEVFITRNLQSGDAYSAKAALLTSADPGISALIEFCQAAEDPGWDNLNETYLSLPVHLEQRVYELARKIAGDAGTPFQKAISIQNYLSRNYRYTMDVGEHPENRDFVTEFLMNTRKGYCTYFASAMTVLCRMNGLPARYVEGYRATPDAGGEALVTGLDAHAWTEVYFKGFGWLPFDPTPGRQGEESGKNQKPPDHANPENTPSPAPPEEPDPEPAENTPFPTQTPEPEDPPALPDEPENPSVPTPPPDADGEETQESRNESGFPWIWVLLMILAGGLAARIVLTSPGFREKRAKSEQERAFGWIQEIERLLAADRLTRKKGETPLSFSERVDRTGLYSTALRPAGELVSLLAYSVNEADAADTALLKDTAVILRSEISRPGRIRYWASRIIFPSGRRGRRKERKP